MLGPDLSFLVLGMFYAHSRCSIYLLDLSIVPTSTAYILVSLSNRVLWSDSPNNSCLWDIDIIARTPHQPRPHHMYWEGRVKRINQTDGFFSIKLQFAQGVVTTRPMLPRWGCPSIYILRIPTVAQDHLLGISWSTGGLEKETSHVHTATYKKCGS